MMELLQRRTHSLIDLVKESVAESHQIEHCHELDQLHQRLLETAQTTSSRIDSPISGDHGPNIQEIYSTVFPLLEKSSVQNCNPCNLCEALEQQIDE